MFRQEGSHPSVVLTRLSSYFKVVQEEAEYIRISLSRFTIITARRRQITQPSDLLFGKMTTVVCLRDAVNKPSRSISVFALL